MTRKPDGKPKQNERMSFTRQSVERITKVVREVEAGNRDLAGISFGSAPGGVLGKTFRVATYTGAWSKNTVKTVTFRGVTATPNTAVATNIFSNLSGSGTRNCAIAKDGTAWFLIAAEC